MPSLPRRVSIHTLKQREHIAPLIEKSSKLLSDLKNKVDESAHGILLEWEDTVQYQHSAETEWLYLRGVKDGMGKVKEIKLFLKHHHLEL